MVYPLLMVMQGKGGKAMNPEKGLLMNFQSRATRFEGSFWYLKANTTHSQE